MAAAIALAVTAPHAERRVYNLGERHTPTVAERVRRLADAAGWTGRVVVVPERDLPEHQATPYNFEYHLATDTRLVRDELGFAEHLSEAEALRRTIAWEREHPPENGSRASHSD